MKFTIEIPVSSRLKIAEKRTATHDGITVELIPDESGWFQIIRFTTSLTDERYTSPMLGSHGWTTVVFDYQGIDPRCSEVEEFARKVEGLCVFSLSTARFHWEKMLRGWEAESEEELERIGIIKDSPWNEERSEPMGQYLEGMAEDLVRVAPRVEPLRHLLLFWREGLNAYLAKNYVLAYYNFYFILEALYSSNLKGFMKSPELCEALQWAFAARGDPDHGLGGIEKAMGRWTCGPTPRGLCKFIYVSRGHLHHMQKQRPPVLYQEDYRAEASLLYVATSRILRKKVASAAGETAELRSP